MEVLDNVYKAFSNLDRDFARSKKTRSEFIIDKFGGDLDMGSMIILDAISSSDVESPEDIEKLTFVKNTIAHIMDARSNLDSLRDFSFGALDDFNSLLTSLVEAQAAGTHMRMVSQKELNRKDKGTIHFISTPTVTAACPLMAGKAIHAYNESMQLLFEGVFSRGTYEVGKYYERKSAMHAIPISEDKISRVIR